MDTSVYLHYAVMCLNILAYHAEYHYNIAVTSPTTRTISPIVLATSIAIVIAAALKKALNIFFNITYPFPVHFVSIIQNVFFAK